MQPNQKVIDWLNAQLEESLFLSAITIGEIQKGITLLPVSKRRNDLGIWLENIILRYDRRILSLDTKVMQAWGELTSKLEQKGRVLPFIDSLIAATVLVHKLILVTQNEKDFAGTGVKVLNIWK